MLIEILWPMLSLEFVVFIAYYLELIVVNDKTADYLVAEIMVFVLVFHKKCFISVHIFISILFERRKIVGRIVPLMYFGDEVQIINIFLINVSFPILLLYNNI